MYPWSSPGQTHPAPLAVLVVHESLQFASEVTFDCTVTITASLKKTLISG